jgi:hypothetical protein
VSPESRGGGWGAEASTFMRTPHAHTHTPLVCSAVEAMEAAYNLDPLSSAVRTHLLDWALEAWGPRLDKTAADARAARAAAERVAEAARRAEASGGRLKAHVERERRRRTLARWFGLHMRHFAAAAIARVFRGHRARRATRALRTRAARIAASTKRVTGRIAAHLLRAVLGAWHGHWRALAARRRHLVAPIQSRTDWRRLVAALGAWRARARRQTLGRVMVGKAMRRLRTLAASTERALAPVFYSRPLTALANFPEARAHHEERILRVLEGKERTAEILKAAQLPSIDSRGSKDDDAQQCKKKKKKKKTGVGS